MQKSISLRLRQCPQSEKPRFEPSLHSWFLLDFVRGEQTLAAFYQNGDVIEQINALVLGTPHAHLIDVSPLLIKLACTDLPDSIYEAIQKERSGIFFQASDDDILAQLQYLFTMSSDKQNLVYARYYDPFFWIGAQLSLTTQQYAIWGNIRQTYTLMRNHQGEFTYLSWRSPHDNDFPIPTTNKSKPILLSDEFYDVSDRVKLLNLLYQINYEEPLNLADERIDITLTHLKTMAKAGITRPDLLKRCVPFCTKFNDFSEQPAVRDILSSRQASYAKVDALEELFKESKQHE